MKLREGDSGVILVLRVQGESIVFALEGIRRGVYNFALDILVSLSGPKINRNNLPLYLCFETKGELTIYV